MVNIDHINLQHIVHTIATHAVSSRLVKIPCNSTNYGLHSLQTQSSKEWNSLPQNIRNIKAISRFKVNVKNFLFSAH